MEGAIDVRMFEGGNGGDLLLNGNDFVPSFSFESFAYFGMFGGNPGHITPKQRNAEEQAFDFWGNDLIWRDSEAEQWNSYTEQALQGNVMTSEGRLRVLEAVKKDLKFMEEFAEVNVQVNLVGLRTTEIIIDVVKVENSVDKSFRFIWDGFNLIQDGAVFTPFVPLEGLQYGLQFDLG
jgi:hypothetical protein